MAGDSGDLPHQTVAKSAGRPPTAVAGKRNGMALEAIRCSMVSGWNSARARAPRLRAGRAVARGVAEGPVHSAAVAGCRDGHRWCSRASACSMPGSEIAWCSIHQRHVVEDSAMPAHAPQFRPPGTCWPNPGRDLEVVHRMNAAGPRTGPVRQMPQPRPRRQGKAMLSAPAEVPTRPGTETGAVGLQPRRMAGPAGRLPGRPCGRHRPSYQRLGLPVGDDRGPDRDRCQAHTVLSHESQPASKPLSRRRELWLFVHLRQQPPVHHILDFHDHDAAGPQFTALFGITDAQFGLLVSAYTLAAGASGPVASTYIDRFGRKRLLLALLPLLPGHTGLRPGWLQGR